MAKAKKAKGRAARSRRGKGEAMTEAKANAVEVRTGLLTDALALPNEKDYKHHREKVFAAQDALETAKSRNRKAIQDAQAAGIDTEAMLEARRIVRGNDPAKTAAQLNQLAFALQMEGFRIQFTLFDTLGGDQMDQVYRRFYQDGKDGKALDNRYPAGSDLALQAERAWRHGSAANMNPPVSPKDADAAMEDDELLAKLAKLPPPPDMAAQASVH